MKKEASKLTYESFVRGGIVSAELAEPRKNAHHGRPSAFMESLPQQPSLPITPLVWWDLTDPSPAHAGILAGLILCREPQTLRLMCVLAMPCTEVSFSFHSSSTPIYWFLCSFHSFFHEVPYAWMVGG